ncbi:hypothetical protein GGR50DRAFT_675797 [Xylaria sp. CBS 124048]|nr:hypothetical protein GGR50DRAFT_675797 [Xylaria sp. CBS 124048]
MVWLLWLLWLSSHVSGAALVSSLRKIPSYMDPSSSLMDFQTGFFFFQAFPNIHLFTVLNFIL